MDPVVLSAGESVTINATGPTWASIDEAARQDALSSLENQKDYLQNKVDRAMAELDRLRDLPDSDPMFNAEYHPRLVRLKGWHDDVDTERNEGFTPYNSRIKGILVMEAEGEVSDWILPLRNLSRIIENVRSI